MLDYDWSMFCVYCKIGLRENSHLGRKAQSRKAETTQNSVLIVNLLAIKFMLRLPSRGRFFLSVKFLISNNQSFLVNRLYILMVHLEILCIPRSTAHNCTVSRKSAALLRYVYSLVLFVKITND